MTPKQHLERADQILALISNASEESLRTSALYWEFDAHLRLASLQMQHEQFLILTTAARGGKT